MPEKVSLTNHTYTYLVTPHQKQIIPGSFGLATLNENVSRGRKNLLTAIFNTVHD
jgi:hypothetical protein